MAVALESASPAGWSLPPSDFSTSERNIVSEGSTLGHACWRIRDALRLPLPHDAETRFRLRRRAHGRWTPDGGQDRFVFGGAA